MICEDISNGQILGTANITAGIGLKSPTLFFQLSHETLSVGAKDAIREDTILTPATALTGYAEVGGLMVSARAKGMGLGRILSLSRYVLMRSEPTRFPTHVMANIRGWLDGHGRSPVWEAIGRRFFPTNFDETDRAYGRGDKDALVALMPKHPIYSALLPQDAQEALGRPHEDSAPALNLLRQEGFEDKGVVFFMDAGPCVEAELSRVRAYGACVDKPVLWGDSMHQTAPSCLVAHGQGPEFRLMRANCALDRPFINLPFEMKQALGVAGDGDHTMQCVAVKA